MNSIIGAIIFSVLFLLLILQQSELLESVDRHSAERTYVQNSAGQMAQFYAASLKFLSGFGSPANGIYITVSDLKKNGLLPGAFPDYTPFGFQLQGWPVADPQNTSITNLTVISVAPQPNNSAEMDLELNALASTGFGRYSANNVPVGDLQQINAEIQSFLTPSLLSQYSGPLSTTQAQSVTIGHAIPGPHNDLAIETSEGVTLVPDTGINSSVLPSYEEESPAIEVVAPNQLGYTILSYSGYFYYTPWDYLPGTSELNGNVNLAYFNGGAYDEPQHIQLVDLGWSPTCPETNDIITPATGVVLKTNDVINAETNSPAQGMICIQTYRSEKVNADYVYTVSTDNETTNYANGGNYNINGGQGGSNYIQPYTYTGGAYQVQNPGNSAGFSYSINGQGSYTNIKDLPYVNPNLVLAYTSTAQYTLNGVTYNTPWPQNNFWEGTLPTLFTNIGLNLTVLQPSGATGAQVNTYQILFGAYQLPTGQGYSWGQLGLPVPNSPQSGATGAMPWNNNYSIWRGFCMGTVQNGNTCIPNAYTQQQEENNLLTGNSRNLVTGVGSSDVTTGWYFKVIPETNTGTGNINGAIIANLPYVYTDNQDSQQTEYYSATIPSSAMCNSNYTNGQSGNCPGYTP